MSHCDLQYNMPEMYLVKIPFFKLIGVFYLLTVVHIIHMSRPTGVGDIARLSKQLLFRR